MRVAILVGLLSLLCACGSSDTASSGSGSSGTSAASGSSGSSGSVGGSNGSSGSTGETGSSGSASSSSGSSGSTGSVDAGHIDCTEAVVFADGGFSGVDPWEDLSAGHTVADRGQLLRCVHVASYTPAELDSTLYFAAHGDTASFGSENFIIEYMSIGRPDQPRAVTALVYAPADGGSDLPLVAVDHGTSGMGPPCGPTHTNLYTDYMAMPLVGHGYAVVATDYAGMGVDDGVEPYLDGASEAANALDAIKAMGQFHDGRFDASQLGTDLFVMGHSQGGQASLFTHQLYDPSLGYDLLGSVNFAPALGDLRGANTLFGATNPVSEGDVFLAMALYGDVVGHDDRDAGAIFSASALAGLPALLHDQCLDTLDASIPAAWPTQGALYAAPFLSAIEACSFTGTCPDLEPYHGDLEADVPGGFTSAAPALILQGEADTTVAPISTACIAARLTTHGTPNQACGYAGEDHIGVVIAAMPDALTWMNARRTGQTPDVCPAPLAEVCP